MAGLRAAGYCSHCNRGVSIVRPQASGLMDKMRTALKQSDDNSNWVCTKCGQPATRGFAPAPKQVMAATDAGPAEEIAADETPAHQNSPTAINAQTAVAPPQPVIRPEAEGEAATTTSPPIVIKLEDNPERPEISKALCTQCHFELTYPKRLTGKSVDCPSCAVHFCLP